MKFTNILVRNLHWGLKKKTFFFKISRSVFSFSITILIIKNVKPKFF